MTVGDDGALHGDNTDGYGFISHLRQEAPGWKPAAPVALLGAGGAARAAVDALLAAGVSEIRLFNRTEERAAALAEEAGEAVRPLPWDERGSALEGCGLLVNTTQLGQVGKPALELVLDRLPADAVVYDLVYAPLETDLLRSARARGNVAVDGLGMLIHQARPGFAAWFGAEAQATAALRAFAAEGL